MVIAQPAAATPEPQSDRWMAPTALAAGLHTLLVLCWLGWLPTVGHSVEKAEPLLCNLSWQWRHGVFPFTTLDGCPALFNPYGVVYCWLCKILPWAPGQPYLSGRLLTLASTFGVFLLLGWLAARRAPGWTSGALAAALFLTARSTIEYGAIYRVDMLVLLLTVAGIALAFECRGRVGQGLAAVVLAVAVHAKITAVAAPLTILLWLWRRDRAGACWFAAVWAGLAIGGLLLLEHWTHGVYLDHASLLAVQWTRPFDILARPFGPSLLWIGALIIGVQCLSRSDKDDLAPERLWLTCSLVVCAVTATNRGGSWNYLLETYAALALLSAGVLRRAVQTVDRPRAVRWLQGLLLGHFLLSLVHSGCWIAMQREVLAAYAPRVAAAEAELAPHVRAGERIVVSGSAPHADALLLLDAGSPIDLMWSHHELAQQLTARAIARGQVDYAVERLDRW